MKKNKSLLADEDIDLMLEHLKSEDDYVYKDFTSLRNSFSREIDLKEDKRHLLAENILQLEKKRAENLKKIEVLNKNNTIYAKNIDEIKSRQTNLTKRENWIKINYSDTVSGAMTTPQKSLNMDNSDTLSDTFYNLFKENMKTHERQVKSKLEELQTQKEKFLKTLENMFEQYDNELISISEEKEDLNKLYEEIDGKWKNAANLKKELSDDNDRMAEQIENDEKELETTEDDEIKLIKEFQKILQRMKADLNVSDVIMNVLFSSSSNEKNIYPGDQHLASQKSASPEDITI